MNAWLIVADLLLAAGFTARLTRLVVTDDLGKWWVQDTINEWAAKHLSDDEPLKVVYRDGKPYEKDPGWRKYLDGLTCPFCVGWWLGVLVLLSLWLVGGPGHAAEAWRYIAGAFSLNYAVAHIGVRLGDAGYADDE